MLFVVALAVFGLQSIALRIYPGRDMGRYVQAFLQLWYQKPVLPTVVNERGPLAALGVGAPLEVGGWAVEVWLGLLYAASLVAWGGIARLFGPRAAIFTTAALLLYPGYGILFHALASDSLFAAAFAGWAVLVSRAILRPSVRAFLLVGLVMGSLVLVRPANQVLIVFALLPLVLRAPWGRRFSWVAAVSIAYITLTEGWVALEHLRYGDAVAPKPSTAALVAASVLLPLLFAAPWRRRLVSLALLAAVGAVAVKGSSLHDPGQFARSLAPSPGGSIFLFRAFEIDRIVSPDNGPASRTLGTVVQRELLSKEPYRSYGIGMDEFFSSGSDRIFQDLQTLGGSVDLPAVTREAIRRHWSTFAAGIARTNWAMLWTRRVYAPESGRSSPGASTTDFIVVDGRRLPRPSEGQPIPSSRFSPRIGTVGGQAHEVWRSATEHPLVFSDPRDERRFEKLARDTTRLSNRMPAPAAQQGLVHRLNQASHAFPPPVVWLAFGLLALILRRPRRAVVALALSAAGLGVIVGTSLVAFPVAQYAAPVSPAFILLAVVGLVGVQPRGRPGLPWRRGPQAQPDS